MGATIDLRRAHDYAVFLLLPLGSFLNNSDEIEFEGYIEDKSFYSL